MSLLVNEKKNFQLLQVLRGVASLIVVFYHATVNYREKINESFLFGYFSFGNRGVDLFFVISGFIITYTSYNSLGQPSKLWTFIKRRFVRIFPVYWIVITGFLLLQITLPSFYNSHYDLNASNLTSTYLLFFEHNMINGVSWTLTFELFFYLLFAFAFLFPSKKWIFFFSIFYSLMLIAFLIFGYQFPIANQWTALIFSPLNLEFFFGVLSVFFINKINTNTGKWVLVVGLLFFLTSAVFTNMGIKLLNNDYNKVILFGIPSAMILSGLVKLELNREFKPYRFLVQLGEASYSLYLLHLPILAAGLVIFQKLSIENNILLHILLLGWIFVICIISLLFFKKIEKPLIGKLNRLLK